jgi:VCBS repeat protein
VPLETVFTTEPQSPAQSRFVKWRFEGVICSTEPGADCFMLLKIRRRSRRRAKDKILRKFWGFLLLSLGLISPCGAETFRNPRHIAIPSNPLQVGTADFNGDGRPDFYYADASGLNVILANADGSYAAPKTTAIGAATPVGTPLGLAASSCRAADFNGDGFADAVCFTPETETTPSAAIFIGNGDGTLRANSTLSIPNNFVLQGPEFFFIAFADMNSDRHLDIVFYSTGTLFTAFGNGSGQFENVVLSRLSFADVSWVKGATVADINGDGHPDIVFTDDPMVMLGVGDGTFTEANNNLLVGTDCHLADFDKDGHLDLFCARLGDSGQGTSSGNLLEIHHGNPDGTFTIAPVYSKSHSYADFISPFAARDLNGDGYPDILALSADGLVIFFGKPRMQFSAPVHYAFYNPESFDEDQGDPSLIADYNLDGNLDLAMPGVNGIYIAYGRSDGTFDALPIIRSGLTTSSAVADFNEDGTPDLFTSGTTGLQLSLGKGNGTFSPPVTVQGSGSGALFVGDFNGDKHKDVIAFGQSATDGSFLGQLLLGRGDGTFQDPVAVTNANFLDTYPSQHIAIVDMDGDGRDDLVNATTEGNDGTNAVIILLSKGDGSLEPITTLLTGTYYNHGDAAPADLNGDGKADLIVPTPQTIQILLGHGDGTFEIEPAALLLPPFKGQPSQYVLAVVAGDFDHDGKADFAVLCLHASNGSNEGPTAVFVYYGKGDGTFSQPVTAAVLDRLYSNFSATDLNGDGLSDFVLSTREGNDYRGTAISIIHGLFGRKFSAETNLIAGQGFVSMVAADFNHDGQPDLLFTNGNYADSLVLLTNIGTPAMTLTSSVNPSVIGQAVTFTATISAPADLTVLPGASTITFEGLPDGSAAVPITFAASGSGGHFQATATYEAAALPVGSTLIKATFPGDRFLNAASASLTQVVNPPPSYQLVASPTTLAVKAGATANNAVTITVKALYGFNGTVSLACTVAYLGAGTDDSPPTCRFGTNPMAVKGSDASTQLIVSTTAATAAGNTVAGDRALGKTGIVLWGGVLLLLLPGRLRSRWLAAAMMILVVSGSMLSLSSCSGTAGLRPPTGPPGTPPPTGAPGTQTGSYSVTVSATSDTTVPEPPPVTVQLTVD